MKALKTILLLIPFFLLTQNLLAQKTLGIYGGVSKPNLCNGDKAVIPNHHYYDEEAWWKPQFDGPIVTGAMA